ncbi:hypothetical protein [Catalinimonas niigatensis]|nr:hypothetical protein [Catalinimonas niigatensis]WPP52751.1 hypothetical protein PZB72_10210 [Catalinimonas niigatensis]
MKTPYESRFKFGIDNYLFGKAKKKARSFYWVLFVIYFLLAVFLQWVFNT